jgi:hypothetical protein
MSASKEDQVTNDLLAKASSEDREEGELSDGSLG